MNTKTNTFIFIHEIDSILFMYIKSVQRQLLFFSEVISCYSFQGENYLNILFIHFAPLKNIRKLHFEDLSVFFIAPNFNSFSSSFEHTNESNFAHNVHILPLQSFF